MLVALGAKESAKRIKKTASVVCPVVCDGFPSVDVCCPSLALYVEMEDVHVGASNATLSLVLPEQCALRFELVHPFLFTARGVLF